MRVSACGCSERARKKLPLGSAQGPLKGMATKTIKKIKTLKKSDEAKWPNQRNVLFKPDRLRYVRRKIVSEGCVFCTANKQGVKLKSLVLGVHGTAMVVLNKYPYNSGHLLILPRRHEANLLSLTEQENRDVQELLRSAVAALEDLYVPSGINIGLNLGAAAGAGIPGHLHWHVIPRWAGDVNFFPLIAQTKVVVETLARSYERLSPFFKNCKT